MEVSFKPIKRGMLDQLLHSLSTQHSDEVWLEGVYLSDVEGLQTDANDLSCLLQSVITKNLHVQHHCMFSSSS